MEARTSHEYVGSRIGRLGRAHVYHIACWAFINGDRTQIGLRKNPTCVQNGLNCCTIHLTIVIRFLGHVVSIIFRAFVTNWCLAISPRRNERNFGLDRFTHTTSTATLCKLGRYYWARGIKADPFLCCLPQLRVWESEKRSRGKNTFCVTRVFWGTVQDYL